VGLLQTSSLREITLKNASFYYVFMQATTNPITLHGGVGHGTCGIGIWRACICQNAKNATSHLIFLLIAMQAKKVNPTTK